MAKAQGDPQAAVLLELSHRFPVGSAWLNARDRRMPEIAHGQTTDQTILSPVTNVGNRALTFDDWWVILG